MTVAAAPLTVADRAAAFAQTFPEWPAAWPRLVRERDRDVLYATWMLGNDYRVKSRFYGGYPPGYLARVQAFFPDIAPRDTLHAFSGALPPGPYVRCDCVQPAELTCSIETLPSVLPPSVRFQLVIADPPYSAPDAVRYHTPMINRLTVTRALHAITQPGAYLAWLDTVWPMHRRQEWVTVGRITIVRSTNHRIRLLTLFRRENQIDE